MTLHDKAVSLAKELKHKETELLEVLMQMRASSEFPEPYTNIYDYCTGVLNLSESQSYYFKKVAEKSEEVPALKTAIEDGRLTLSQARRIVPVVSNENLESWIEKTEQLPQRELERAVAVENPKSVVRESLKPVAANRTELRVGISFELEKKLRRLQDVLGGTLEEVLEKAIGETLERKDPIRKAERGFLRKQRPPSVKNVVHWRDSQCTVPGCRNTRFLEVHHIKHRAHGGSEAPENLRLLCWAHHQAEHSRHQMAMPSSSSHRNLPRLFRKPNLGAAEKLPLS